VALEAQQHPHEHAEHRARQRVVPRQQIAKTIRKTQHPLALAATQGTQRTLRAALTRLAQADAFRAAAADLADKLTAILRDWTGLTRKPVAQQRQLLRKLVPDRLTVTPQVQGARRWVDWVGDLAVAPIISGIAPAVGDVMPEPMDQRWWPQRDSNPCLVSARRFLNPMDWFRHVDSTLQPLGFKFG